VLNAKAGEKIDLAKLKQLVKEYSAKLQEDKDTSNFDQLRDELKLKVLLPSETKPANAVAGVPAAATESPTDAKGDKPASAPAVDAKPAEAAAKDDDAKKEDKK